MKIGLVLFLLIHSLYLLSCWIHYPHHIFIQLHFFCLFILYQPLFAPVTIIICNVLFPFPAFVLYILYLALMKKGHHESISRPPDSCPWHLYHCDTALVCLADGICCAKEKLRALGMSKTNSAGRTITICVSVSIWHAMNCSYYSVNTRTAYINDAV